MYLVFVRGVVLEGGCQLVFSSMTHFTCPFDFLHVIKMYKNDIPLPDNC